MPKPQPQQQQQQQQQDNSDDLEFVTSFKELDPICTERVMSSGDTGSGKTHLITTMPGRVGILALEPNSRTTLEQRDEDSRHPGTKLLIPKLNFMYLKDLPDRILTKAEFDKYYENACREEDSNAAKNKRPPQYPDKKAMATFLEEGAIQVYYHDLTMQIEAYVRSMVRREISSAAIDSGTELFDIYCLAHIGRRPKFGDRAADLSPINADLRRLLHQFSSRCNLLVTHHEKSEFKVKPGEKTATPTGEMIADGWKRINYNMSIYVQHIWITDKTKLAYVQQVHHRKDAKLGQYACCIMKAHGNYSLPKRKDGRGVLLDHEINFANLLLRVYPDRDLIEDYGYTEEEVEDLVLNSEEIWNATRERLSS